MNIFKINQWQIGGKTPCFIIAEAGVNHNGCLDTALAMVDAASQAGASAVKFQTFNADRLALPDTPKCAYQICETGQEQSQHEMLKKLEISHSFHKALIDRSRARGILFLSSPFDEDNADFLVSLGICALKIPSGEITNLSFLHHVAAQNLPLIVSTGMACLGEVENAVESIADVRGINFGAGLALMHCLSCYPAPPNEVNLRAMSSLRSVFGCPVGFSDHTQGIEVALAAVAIGADIIEKHFTLDKNQPGPDHNASLDPNEFAAMVRGIRKVESCLGNGYKQQQLCEKDVAAVARKSITSLQAIAKGTMIEPSMLIMRRPGTGLSPSFAPMLLGRVAARDIPANHMITLDDI